MKTVIDQFARRAGTYSGSANWISDQTLIQSHIQATGGLSAGFALEICCGTGMVGRNFRTAGWAVCGIDLTREMALEANRHFPCICTSAENIPFMDNAFDLVLLRQAYFLLDNGQNVLAEANRVLKKDGLFILSQTVPFSSEDEGWLEKIHRTKQASLREFFTEETLAAELEKRSFEIIDRRRLSVRENITKWMAAAPELSLEKREEVCSLVSNSPGAYRQLHRVEVVSGEIFEDWNWVVFTARPKGK